jgi:hypothetical protein
MRSVLESKLDRLAEAFDARGIPVQSNLRPRASDEELDELAQRLNVALPKDLRALYRWRNGHVDPEAGNVLRFRDTKFIALDAIQPAHRLVNEIYGGYDDDPDNLPLLVDLAECVPIAEFMESWLVVACGPQTATTRSRHPVFLAFQGVYLVFYSIESMVDTCIDWVEQPEYRPDGETPNEHEIWERHNPDIFTAP